METFDFCLFCSARCVGIKISNIKNGFYCQHMIWNATWTWMGCSRRLTAGTFPAMLAWLCITSSTCTAAIIKVGALPLSLQRQRKALSKFPCDFFFLIGNLFLDSGTFNPEIYKMDYFRFFNGILMLDNNTYWSIFPIDLLVFVLIGWSDVF